MVRKALVPLLVSLVVLTIIFPAGLIPRGHAATTSLICVATITDVTNKCPTAHPSFNGPLTTPSTLLRVPIMINNTDAGIDGFDITLKVSDISKLQPYDADLVGTIAPSNVILEKCIGGVKLAGSTCAPSTDTPDTIHLGIIITGSPLPAGLSGLLFTAVFKIVGTTLPGGINIGYQTGCQSSSVSGSTICVSITNGTTVLVPEAVQSGSFDNSDTTTLAFATISTNSTSLGQSLAGAPTHTIPPVRFVARSQNGFNASSNPTIQLAVAVNASFSVLPMSLSTFSLDLTNQVSLTFTETGTVSSGVSAGLYVATVTATYQTSDLITFTTDSLAATYSLPLDVVDYGLSVSPNPVTVQPGTTQPVTVTITPKAGFNALVKLGIMIPASTAAAGITATYSSTTILGGAGTSSLSVAASSSTPRGIFQITITSNSTLNGFSKIHTAALTVTTTRPDFAISANPTSVILPPPGNGTFVPTSTIIVTSFNFTGAIQLTLNVSPAGLDMGLLSPVLTLRLGGQNSTTLAPMVTTSTPPGTYHATVTGASGSISHFVNLTFIVPNSFPSDFTMSANPAFITLPTGSASTTSVITVSSLNGFSGSVSLAASSAFLFALGLNMSQVNIAVGGSAGSILTIAGLNIGPGTFPVTVSGTHFSVVNGTTVSMLHTVLIMVQVLAPPPDFQLFVNLNFGGTTILAGTSSSFNVQVNSVGSLPFEGTITLTGQVFAVLANGPISTLNPSQVTLSSAQPFGFSTLTVSTTSLTPPGNYTITVQGTSGTTVHTVRFQVTILPPPILTLSPTKGSVGTKVTVQGSGFVFPSQGFFNSVQVEMTFDDQLVGLFFLQGSTFNFTFNVPESQVGIVHTVHAKVLFFPLNLDVQASFLVLSEPSTLAVNITAGTVYFPGDTATILAMTALDGQSTTVTSLQIILVRPNGSNITLNTILISPGVYRATFPVPSTGSIGTYAVLANAHETGSTDAFGLASFEVKPTWLQSNGHNVAIAGIVGAVGLLGLVGLVWRKRYFTRETNDFQGF